MKVNRVEVCCLLFLSVVLLWSCTEKTDEPISTTLRQAWDSNDDKHELVSFVYDPLEEYGSDYYVGGIMLSNLPTYANLKKYVVATIDPSLTVLRVINELHISAVTLIPKPDNLVEPPDEYWGSRTPYLLGEICFIIRQKSDSLRFVYLRNRNDSNSIVDTTLHYTGSCVDEILSYAAGSTGEVRLGYARSDNTNNCFFNVLVTIWTEDRSYTIDSWALWYYSDCLNPTTWLAKKSKEQDIVENLIEMACAIRTAGGFQAKYGYRTIEEVQQNKGMED